MALPLPPPLGHPVPNTYHAVSVQLPTWQDMCGMALGEDRVKKVQQIGYPRSFLHRDVREVLNACITRRRTPYESCLVYPTFALAKACKRFLCSRKDAEKALDPDEISVHTIDFDVTDPSILGYNSYVTFSILRLYGTFFPAERMPQAMVFWRLTGTGISSRLAQHLIQLFDYHKAPCTDVRLSKEYTMIVGVWAADTICHRIAALLERSPRNPCRSAQVSASDVFLYQTGMSAIYHCHHLLLKWRGAQSIIFGFPYELTLKMLQTYGESCKFYGFGTPEELDDLELYLQSEADNGRPIQAVWCECPSNPLLRTVDLNRIRKLADRYGFIVVIDETIGSFANVDVLEVADIIVTSLTKSFSGFADVMGGSIVLNTSSPFYTILKASLLDVYCNDLFIADAIQLEHNSRDFLSRATILNSNAFALVALLQPYTSRQYSTLTNVYYPSTCWSIDNYHSRMRPATPEFTPGYGGLFTLEFETVAAASTFFDALEVHKGPSLGANLTLAQPYVQTVFFKEKEWAAEYGLKETIVRISVGLEDEIALVKAFRNALKKADAPKRNLGLEVDHCEK